MILSDLELIDLCCDVPHPLISPFYGEQRSTTPRGDAVISFGLSSFGYDLRCGTKFKLFTNVYGAEIDPKSFDESAFVEVESSDYVLIPPNSFALTSSVEYLIIPRDITGLCLGKSTYARCGIVANFTPLEAGWEGNVTIELSNTTPLPARIYAYEGIAQVLFFRGSQPCQVSYGDRKGKYQGQTGITLPKAGRI